MQRLKSFRGLADQTRLYTHKLLFARRRWYSRGALMAQAPFIMICLVWYYWFELGLTSWPSLAIGLLAFAAVVMTLRANYRWTKAEQVIWIFVSFTLFTIETTSVYLDHVQHDGEQHEQEREQQASFDRVLWQNQVQFAATLAEDKRLLRTTRRVADVARTNLLNVTGGNSYACIWPAVTKGSNEVGFNIHNYGAQVLSGVNVTIYQIVGARMLTHGATQIGSISPREGRQVPPPAGLVNLQATRDVVHYHIWINAQNPGTTEDLFFRRDPGEGGWSYKLDVWRKATGKRQKADVFADGNWIRYLKRTDWIEPSDSPQRP